MEKTPVVETRDLTKHYGATVGLEGLDLTVEAGEVFGFLGPNGAGKTTTIRLLLGLILPTRGTARLFGRPAGESGVRRRVGYLPGELVLDGRLGGRGMLDYLARLGGVRGIPARRGELCERIGLSDDDLRRRTRDYSRGMKQKLGLVAAFEHDPDLVVLDEPTTGLDPLVREVVFDLLAETGRRGRTVFHSSHVLSEVDRTCTRVAVVRDGRQVAVRRIDEIRRDSVRRMVVRFAGEPPLGELETAGARAIEREGRQLVLSVAGDLDPLLRVLARHRVEHLVFPEPSLEEAFVAYYRGEPEGER